MNRLPKFQILICFLGLQRETEHTFSGMKPSAEPLFSLHRANPKRGTDSAPLCAILSQLGAGPSQEKRSRLHRPTSAPILCVFLVLFHWQSPLPILSAGTPEALQSIFLAKLRLLTAHCSPSWDQQLKQTNSGRVPKFGQPQLTKHHKNRLSEVICLI